jgi:hypothetical protein
MSSILHPTESLFVPAWLISVGTILINITEYGADNPTAGPWLREIMSKLFWVYCGLAVFFSCGIYLTMYVDIVCHSCVDDRSRRTNSLVDGRRKPSRSRK